MPADLKQKLLDVKEKLPDQFVDLHLGPRIWPVGVLSKHNRDVEGFIWT